MKRKVVKHGPSTFIVSLPSRWVKEYNIQKGSELDVTEEGNKVIICTEDEVKPLEVSIDITGLDRSSIIYVIRGIYRLGYDVINVTFNSQEVVYQRQKEKIDVLSVIRTEINRLIGYEIIQEREKSCIIKDLQVSSEKEFDQILRRIFFLLMDTTKDFVEGIKTNNKILLETIETKHDLITKFISFCLRLLNKKGYPNIKKTCYYFHIIALLDRTMDIIKYAARDTLKYNKKFSSSSLEMIDMMAQSIIDYHELFYSYNNKLIIDMNIRRYNAEKLLKNLPESTKTQEVIIVAGLFHIFEMLLDLIEARTALEY